MKRTTKKPLDKSLNSEDKKRKVEDDKREQENSKKQMVTSPVEEIDNSYYSFMSAIYQHLSKNTKRDRGQIIEFLQQHFKDHGNVVTWPKNGRKLFVTLNVLGRDNYSILLSEDLEKLKADKQTAIVMSIKAQNLFIEKIVCENPWTIDDIHDVIHHINFIFAASITYHKNLEKIYKEEIDIKAPLDWYEDLEEFKILCRGLNNRYAFPYFLTYHTNFGKDGHVFWLSWKPEIYEDLSLKVSFSTFTFENNTYHPWTLSEEEFAKIYKYPPGKWYIKMTVHEHFSPKREKQIVNAFFNLNFTICELRDIKKGEKLNGTEIMTIFDEVCHLVVKSTDVYLCDSSRGIDAGDRVPGQNVFRISHSLAKGKTMYEAFSFEAIDITNAKPGWPNATYCLFQNASVFKNDREALRALPVKEIYEYFKKEVKTNEEKKVSSISSDKNEIEDQNEAWHVENEMNRANNLNSLCKKTFNLDLEKSERSTPSLGELAAKIYGLFKTKDTDAEKDFQMLHDIFILPEKYNRPLDSSPGFESNKKPVHELQRTIAYTQVFKKTL